MKNPLIQKELALTPEQNGKLVSLDEERERWSQRAQQVFLEERLKLIQKGAGPDEVQALTKQHTAMAQQRRDEFDAGLLKVLTRKQRERLGQIKLQAEGPMAFTRPELQEQLNMDEEQAALIGGIIAEGRMALSQEAALSPEFRPAGRQSAEERQRLHDSKAYKTAVEKTKATAVGIRDRTMQAIRKVLTKKQREKYTAMRGEPFGLENLQAKPGGDSKR